MLYFRLASYLIVSLLINANQNLDTCSNLDTLGTAKNDITGAPLNTEKPDLQRPC